MFGDVHVENGKASTIVKAVIGKLDEIGVDKAKLVSLGSDRANVMTGNKKGVGVVLKGNECPILSMCGA